MRILVLGILALLAGLPASAQTEFFVGTAVQSTDKMGQDGTQASFGGGVRLAADLWDLSVSAKRASLDKVGTPGGHQWTYSAGVRRWVGPNFYLDIGAHRILADATIWTKRTWWAEGGIGLCARYGKTATRRPHRDELSLKYGKEVATDAVAPNRTRGLTLRWMHDLPITGNAFLRGTVSSGFWSYLQDGTRRSGTSSSLGVEVVIRKSDL